MYVLDDWVSNRDVNVLSRRVWIRYKKKNIQIPLRLFLGIEFNTKPRFSILWNKYWVAVTK